MQQFCSVSDKETQPHRWIYIFMIYRKHIMAKESIYFVSFFHTMRIQVYKGFLRRTKYVMSFSRSPAQYSNTVSLLFQKIYHDFQKICLWLLHSDPEQYDNQSWIDFCSQNLLFRLCAPWNQFFIFFNLLVQKLNRFWPFEFVVKYKNLKFWVFILVLKLAKYVCNMARTVPLPRFKAKYFVSLLRNFLYWVFPLVRNKFFQDFINFNSIIKMLSASHKSKTMSEHHLANPDHTAPSNIRFDSKLLLNLIKL
jgi:hypothetical protein